MIPTDHIQFNDEFDVYRVRTVTDHPLRNVRKAWYGRTWQAEWTGCVWCPRAYTERGVRRKARRWMKHPAERQYRMVRRRSWWRVHVTRRRDPFYAARRKATS